MGFTGLSIATSGLRTAHLNLGITGHNMSNAEIRGFSRQRVVQNDAFPIERGINGNGDRMQLGMGVNRYAVEQLRNEFLDFTYRKQVSRLQFYNSLVVTGREIENMLGEMYGAYNFQGVVNDMWFAIQELSRHPDGFAVRQLLLSTSNSFLNKAREVYNGLVEEQRNLNAQVIQTVNEINHLVSEVDRLNRTILIGELAGDNANDFRDQRNLALDQLAELIPIETKINSRGEVNILSMGHELLANGNQSLMGLRFVSADYNFVIPVLGTDGQTVSAQTPPGQFINYMHLRPIDYANQNDFGTLHGLLLARGMAPANHMSDQVPSLAERLAALGDILSDAWTNLDWDGADWTNVADIDTMPALVAALEDAFPTNPAHQLREVFDDARAGTVPPDVFFAAVRAFMTNDDNFGTDQHNVLLEALIAAGVFDPDAIAEVQAIQNSYNYLHEHLAAYTFNHQLHLWSIQHGMIPRVQQNLDGIVYKMVRMLNDALTGQLREVNPNFVPGGSAEHPNPPEDHPNYALLEGGRLRFVEAHRCTDAARSGYPFNHVEPWNLDGETGGIPLFIRRYSQEGADVDPTDLNTIFTIENLRINPLLLQPGGHNLLALSLDRDAVNDTRVLEALQLVWRIGEGPYTVEIGGREFRVQDAYIRLVGQISTDVNEAIRFTEAQRIQVIQADNRRQAIKGVSMDEELAAMLRFQYAFQAASRVINVLDSMIEVLVRIGRS
jgi:flagellar hook-associated protein FlgK